MIDERRVEGAVREVGGRVQDALGGLAGDHGLQAEGKANQLAGQAQGAVGALADDVRDVGDRLAAGTQQYPLAALLLSGTIGFVLGMLVTR